MKMEKSGDEKAEKEPFILFEVAKTTYGVRSHFVQQMEMIDNITGVPNTPGYIDGVMFARGEAIPVINLRARFGRERIDYDLKTRVIIIRYEGRSVGLIADAAREYVNLPAGSIQQTSGIMGSDASWLEGIIKSGDRTILILNINELLKTENKQLSTINK